jgi:hypothetical protein
MSDEERKDWQNEMDGLSFVNSGRPSHQAPEGYFDQLPDHIIDRWHKAPAAPQGTVIAFWKRIATAAVVTGICIGITWLTNKTAGSQEDNAITSGEAYEYIMEHIDEFAPLIQQTNQLVAEKTPSPESAAIEQYLLEELESEDFENLF